MRLDEGIDSMREPGGGKPPGAGRPEDRTKGEGNQGPRERPVDLSKWLATLATSVIAYIVVNLRPADLLCASERLKAKCSEPFGQFRNVFALDWYVSLFWLLGLGTLFLALSVGFSVRFRLVALRGDSEVAGSFRLQTVLLALGSAMVLFVPVLDEKGAEQFKLKVHGITVDGSSIPREIRVVATGIPEKIVVEGGEIPRTIQVTGNRVPETVTLRVDAEALRRLQDSKIEIDLGLLGRPGGVKIGLELPKGPLQVVVPPLVLKEGQTVGIDPKKSQVVASGSVALAPQLSKELAASFGAILGRLDKIKESVDDLGPTRHARGVKEDR